MKRLIMVRHGETNFNRQHRLQGQRDTPLNDEGIRQAKQVAKVLSNETFDAIWSSPLQRALATTDAINEHHQKPVTIRNELIERSFGDMEGEPVAKIRALEQEHSGPIYTFTPPQAESFAMLEQRAQQFVDSFRHSPYEHLLLVGHAGIFRAIIASLLGWDFERWFELAQHNTCINSFRFEQGVVVAYQLDDHEHLSTLAE